ncbi:glycosyl transferase [Rivularia sp. PCC 7116]|uniref:glycosyltransferase family 2 protein n=1 Tax=Rivularia sp. PCC 7116 TaxID=373994 RepID=UPI00029EC37B|nr:glycosyltransferase family 2 protein [Rivularia sp. PCC 7116]AFY55946.1 glycosyl transferase [Rivularia sp. PCC 7116]
MYELTFKLIALYAIKFILISLSSIIFIVCLFFLLESAAASISKDFSVYRDKWQDTKITVLIPAHNEEISIASTLETIIPVLKKQDDVVVVADNCSDRTAEIARSIGATVIERFDSLNKGKGYALDYGLQYMEAEPPDVVVIIDADCKVEQGAIEQLTECSISTNRPVQASYLMVKPDNSVSSKDFVSQFSIIVRNFVRPLGLKRLGVPSPLLGTGMAFPFSVIRSVNVASGHLLEDIKLGLDLNLIGHKPIFYPQARVTAYLPSSSQAAKSQKTRWIHGHLQIIQTYIPILLKQAILQKRFDLLPSILDLCIPPLTLAVMTWWGLMTISLVFALFQGLWMPAILSLSAGLCLFAGLFLAWAKFAINLIPLDKLLAVPLYVLGKIPVYLKFIVAPQKAWVRTERE